jgi:hypothetical protein
MPALLNLQPGWALLLGGIVLLIAGLVLLWLTQAEAPTNTIQQPLTPVPPLLTFPPLLFDDILEATAQPVVVLDVPRCYDTSANSLMCLGLLKNPTDHLWKNITLSLHLETASQRISLEQTYLLPGQSAPYRVLWPAPTAHEEHVALSVMTPQAQTVSDEVVIIPVQQMSGLWLGQTRYRVRGKLQNPTQQSLKHGQIIVTLLDSSGAVVGYRLRDLPPLLPDASLPFLIDLTPVVYDAALTAQVTVLAWMR